MVQLNLAVVLALCLLLAACSRRDAVFSLQPVHVAHSQRGVDALARCVVQRWTLATHHLHRTDHGDTVRLRAESQFAGVAIGLRLAPDDGATRVGYFERRDAPPLYWTMVESCLAPQADASDAGDEPSTSPAPAGRP